MTCRECQDKLLLALDPSAPPADVGGHIAECMECARVRRRLVRIEANVARVPVPPSRGAESLKRLILQPPQARSRPGAGRGPMLATLATGLAACVVFVVSLYWVLSQFQDAQDRPPVVQKKDQEGRDNTEKPAVGEPAGLLARLLDCDLRLAVANGPAQRLGILADVVEILQDGGNVVTGAREKQAVAALYAEVLQDAVVPLAALLPKDEVHAEVSRLIAGLTRFHDQAVQLAPDDADKEQMTHAAQRTLKQLTALGVAGKATVVTGPVSRRISQEDWSRNLPLARAMVATGRKLALEGDPLKRAQVAQDLAEKVGQEIQLAAQERDGSRAAELSGYFHALLTRAVADNLGLASAVEPRHAMPREDVDRFAAAVTQSTKTVEAELKRAITPAATDKEATNMEAAFQAVSQGRQEVEKSVKGKGKQTRPSEKGKGKGHKK